MIKNYFRILKKPHAYLQTILKTPVKFQKDRTETVGGFKGTKYPLKTRNHAPRTTRHAPRKTKNSVPPLFFEKAGDNNMSNILILVMLNKFGKPYPLLIFTQSDYLIQVVDINSNTDWQTVQIQISWLLQKPTDLDLHCLQMQGISRFSRTRIKG